MKYQEQPVVVEAFRITCIGSLAPGGNILVTTEDGVTRRMRTVISPKIGDYWVIQADGYEYLNPKAVFERKYSKIRGLA